MDFLKKNENDFTLSYKNINYKVEIKDKDTKKVDMKTVIENASGQIKSGQISAIMGPSGAGKSSLLNFLTNRINFPEGSEHSGELYINNEQINFEDLSSYSSYVMQDDVLFDILTPYENIWYACKLKKVVESEKTDECVLELLKDLQLTDCKDTMVGNNEKKGISGGERKRTSIGMEIMSTPSILFLDEPTSGLDSQTSLRIISLLKRLAIEKNIAVCATIHQPSSNIFGMFDNLIIIERANIIYNQNPDEICPYFKSIEKPLNEKSNPADSFMRIIEEHLVQYQGEERNYFIDSYKPKIKEKEESINEYLKSGKLGNNIQCKGYSQAGFCESTLILSKRCIQNIIRNPLLLKMRFGFVVMISFMCASVFWRLDKDTYNGIYGRFGFMFFVAINLFMSQVMGTILSFPVERAVFIRENSSKMYSISAYFAAKNLTETPFLLIVNTIFCIIIYFTTGLRTDGSEHFFKFLATFLIHSLAAQSLGYALGTLFSNISTALTMTNILIMPFILFAGVMLNEESMPRWLFWFKYISPMKYTIELGNKIEFEGNNEITFGGGGDKILEMWNYEFTITKCFAIMISLTIIIRMAAFLFLHLMVKKTG
jgi:ABC-type multidrug transport system ATPase subunit